MKNIKPIFSALVALVMLVAGACNIDDQVDPNGASLNSVLTDATFTELNNLVTGIEARMRNGFDVYVTATGTIARELYLFDADPRNLTDLVGLENDEGVNRQLDNNSFYLTSPYNNRYRVIKNCNILLEAVDNASVEVTEANRNGYRGYANTIKAYQLLLVLNLLDENGIRVDTADPDNLGGFVDKNDAYIEIVRLLDLAITQLSQAGDEFSFALTPGFAGFNTPGSFTEFNRAIKARVEIYRDDANAALTALGESFFDLDGDLTTGPKHVFSTAGPDILNNLFKIPRQSGDQVIVNSDFISSAEEGDLRVLNKTVPRVDTTSQGGFSGPHETRLYATSTSPIDIIRNEELVLIYAEANIKLNTPASLSEAESALNIIRIAAGLSAYSGLIDADSLTNEMLNQRRYSLWAEGHRMVDLRRYGRLNTAFVVLDTNIDPDTGEELSQLIFTQFPVPLADSSTD